MAIITTVDFDAEKEKRGHFPIFLVELLGLGRFFASKEPGFTGNWLAGQGLIATTTPDTSFEILAGDSQPTYSTLLHKIGNNGIGSISYQLGQDDLARTGDALVSLLNEGYLNIDLDDENVENTVARIMLGWEGLSRAHYISIFSGVVDKQTGRFERLDLRLADDTQRNIVPVPAQIGSDFRPRAFSQGQAFNIVLGDAEDVPMTQLVGAASSFLGVGLLTTDDELFYLNPTTPFPNSGTVRVQSSGVNYTVTYDGVSSGVSGSQLYGKLLNISTPGAIAPVGATVTLEGQLKSYTTGFAGQNIRRIRKSTGAAPAGQPTWLNEAIDPNGEDHRRITVVNLPNATADNEQMTATIASEARGPNLVFNGNFETNVNGWTVGTGAFDSFLPASTFDKVGRIRTLTSQTLQTDVIQDITVTALNRYRLTFTARNSTLVFMACNIGTPSNATKYYQFADMDGTTENLFDLVFQPDETTVRITLIGDNAGSGSAQEGYFDQFDMYEVNTENPSTQIEHLIRTHMPQVEPDAASFAEAFTFYDDRQDRLAGVLNQTEEQQAMLGRLAQQFRARTFLDEDGKQKWVVFDQSRVPERALTTDDIVKGSMKVSRTPLTEINTHYYVYYGRIPNHPTAGNNLGGRGSFTGVAVATPSETSHPILQLNTLCSQAREQFRKESTKEVFADLVPDAQTACNLLEHIVRRGTHQRYVIEFESFLRMVDIEVADFIKVSHPLLPRQIIFEVKEKDVRANGCTTRWTCEQVDIFKFGSYTEGWEIESARLKAEIITESWEPPAPGEGAVASPDNLFPEYTETWDTIPSDVDISLIAWDTTDALTDHLYGAFSTFDAFTRSGYMRDSNSFGLPMYPSIIHSSSAGTESGNAKTTPNGRVFSSSPGQAHSRTVSEFEGNSSSFELRPYDGTNFGEFIRINGIWRHESPQEARLAESYTFDREMPNGLINLERDFSLRIFVRLDTKSFSQPIWQGYDQDNDTTPITRLPFVLYYNNATDRFEFAVLNNIPGAGNTLATNIASLTQKVQATTFGSPSTATWYQILATYDVSTTTASIKVNAGTLDSTVITPDYTTGLAHPGLIGAWSFSDTGATLTNTNRVTFDGKVAAWAYWGRVITTAEGTTLYGGGTPYRFDSIGT